MPGCKHKRKRRSTCPQAGFLLFEVMVAVAVVSVVLMFITRGFSSSLRAVGLSEETMAGVFIAEEKMTELTAELERTHDASILNGRGRFSAPHDDFSWTVRSEEVDDLPLQSVHLVVAWRDGPRAERVELDTYLFYQEGNPGPRSP